MFFLHSRPLIRNYNREENYLKPGCPVTLLDDESIWIKNVNQGLERLRLAGPSTQERKNTSEM